MKSVRIRRWRQDDFARLAEAEPGLSPRTLWLRFAAGMSTLPKTYLSSIARRWPDDWDAVVALDGDQVVGWAECARCGPQQVEVGFCVVDPWQGRGVGTALVPGILELARDQGITRIHADILPSNAAAWALWQRVTGSRNPDFALAAA